MSGLARDGKIKKAVSFVLYQTECHGPQNGFRLALGEEGVMPHDARVKSLSEKGTIPIGPSQFYSLQFEKKKHHQLFLAPILNGLQYQQHDTPTCIFDIQTRNCHHNQPHKICAATRHRSVILFAIFTVSCVV